MQLFCLCHYSGPDVPDVEFLDVVPYFDLESFPGVAELKRQKDANSEPISIPRGIILGAHIATTAYVSSTLVYFSLCFKRSSTLA